MRDACAWEGRKGGSGGLKTSKQQLSAIGDRTFLTREKRLEFQYLNLAVFNIAASNHSPEVLASR